MESYAEFMSSGKRSLQEIIAWKRSNIGMFGKQAVFTPAANDQYQVVVTPFVVPAKLTGGGATHPSNEEVRSMLSQVQGFEFLESIRSHDASGKETIATNKSQLYTVGALNNLPGTLIGMCMARKGVEGNEEDFKIVTSELNDYYYGGGTARGLFTRILEQMGNKSRIFPDPVVGKAEEEYIRRVLPIDYSKLQNLNGVSPSELEIKINYKAHAGAPWFDPKVRVEHVAEEILSGAVDLYNLASEGYDKLKDHLQNVKRDEGVVILKNKRELSKRKNYLSKVRPYYVYPGKLRFLFSCIIDSYSDAMQNAWDNKESISAFRFSWVYGGAVKLASWVASRRAYGSGFYPLSWGDDQLWVVVCTNGDVCIAAPDVIGMDMSLGNNTIKFHTKKIISEYSGKMDEVWKRVTVLYGQYLHNHPVLAYHALVVKKSGRSLSSGVNGTTAADFTGSARITFRAEPILSECKTVEDVVLGMKKVNEVITKELGMTFKDETMVVSVFNDETLTIDVPFLGMYTQNISIDGLAGLVPIPDIPKLSASLFYSKYSKNDVDQISALLSKCVGICASGGYTNLLLYNVCKRMYGFHADKAQPLHDLDWMGGALPDEVSEFLHHEKGQSTKPFPTRRWFMSLYLQDEHRKAEQSYQNKFKSGQVKDGTPGTGYEMTEEEFELLAPEIKESEDWAEMDRVSAKTAQGNAVNEIKVSAVGGLVVSKEKAGLMPPDYERRKLKWERCKCRSEARYRLKQEESKRLRRDYEIERKYDDDEMEVDEDLQALDASERFKLDVADQLAEAAYKEWQEMEQLAAKYEQNLEEAKDDETLLLDEPLTELQKLIDEYGDEEFDAKYDLVGFGGYGNSNA